MTYLISEKSASTTTILPKNQIIQKLFIWFSLTFISLEYILVISPSATTYLHLIQTFLHIFTTNLSSTSRNYFAITFKTHLTFRDLFYNFLNIGLISFVLYLPFYFLHLFQNLTTNENHLSFFFSTKDSTRRFEYLLFASIFGLLTGMISFFPLSSPSSSPYVFSSLISHSCVNSLKRSLIALISLLVFTNQKITWNQLLFGFIFIVLGSFFDLIIMSKPEIIANSSFASLNNLSNICVEKKSSSKSKKILISIIACMILLSSNVLMIHPKSENQKKVKIIEFQRNLSKIEITSSSPTKSARVVCIEKIQGTYMPTKIV